MGSETVNIDGQEVMHDAQGFTQRVETRVTEQITRLRILALNHLIQEAKLVGVDGVIDVTS